MPGRLSPNSVFTEAFDIVRDHHEVTARLGKPVKGSGTDHNGKREGRRNFVANDQFVDEDGVKHTRYVPWRSIYVLVHHLLLVAVTTAADKLPGPHGLHARTLSTNCKARGPNLVGPLSTLPCWRPIAMSSVKFNVEGPNGKGLIYAEVTAANTKSKNRHAGVRCSACRPAGRFACVIYLFLVYIGMSNPRPAFLRVPLEHEPST